MKKDDRPFWTSESFAQWGRRRSPPFGAREGGIHERLVQVRLSALMQAPRQSRRSASSSIPLRTHCWNRRGRVWKGGYLSGSSATAPRCPRPTAHHARRRVCPSTDDRAYRHGALAAAPALPLTLPTAGYLPSIMKCPKLYKELTDRYAVPAKNRLRSASDRFAASGADWPRIFALQKKKAHVHVAVTIRRLLIF